MEELAVSRTPCMQRPHMKCFGPPTRGTEFLRGVIEESIIVLYAMPRYLSPGRAPTARWRGCCSSYTCSSKRYGTEFRANF